MQRCCDASDWGQSTVLEAVVLCTKLKEDQKTKKKKMQLPNHVALVACVRSGLLSPHGHGRYSGQHRRSQVH